MVPAHRPPLDLGAFDAPETKGLVRYYRGMADESGVAVARAETTTAIGQ